MEFSRASRVRLGGSVWSKYRRITMSRECAAAIRRRTRRVANVRSPAIERTLLSRYNVAARTLVPLLRVGRTSALAHRLLSTPRSGPVTARTVACPVATLIVTWPAVTRAGVPHEPLESSKLMTCGPATENVKGTEKVARRLALRLRQALWP